MSSARFNALLAAAPAAFRRDQGGAAPGVAEFDVDVPRLDHTLDLFRIRVHDASPVPEVEEIGGRLPRWCPERHIVGRGRFCLSWSPEPPAFDTPNELAAWWENLLGYLGLQLVAEITGTWPSSRQWAHGAAVLEQHAFEELARKVGPRVADAVTAGRIRPVDAGRVERRRAPCPCGSKLKVKSCHEQELLQLSRLLAAQRAKERKFWEDCAAVPCCRTMNSCPLNSERAQ